MIAITPETTLYFDDIVIPYIWPLVEPIVPPSVRLSALPLMPEITTLRRAPKDIASAIYGKKSCGAQVLMFWRSLAWDVNKQTRY